MRVFIFFTFFFLLSLSTEIICAQKVLYSPFIGTQPATRFEVVGKVGNYYWIQKSKTKFRSKKPAEPWLDDKGLRFEIYDARMNFLKTIPSFLSVDLIKEYLIPGDEYFDQLFLQPSDKKILALLDRYTPDGILNGRDTIAEFPRNMKCGDFLLIRSANRNKILLLGFETISESPSRLHAFLYDKNWKLVYQTTYSHINISKPLVQYDLVEYSLEDYNSTYIKLGNNGEWLMVLSSGINHNYLLFHFNGIREGFAFKEIKLASTTIIEDAGLFLDNEKHQGFAGILSRIKTSPIKNVRIVRYMIDDFRIAFDTSFIINTLANNKIKNENLYEEYFMMVPGKGFLFLKEYGRALSPDPYDNGSDKNDRGT